MPIKLIEPRKGKTPYFAARGKHFGVRIDRSTKARTAAEARKIIRKWERDIESGVFAIKGTKTFAGAALSYMQQGGDPRPVGPLLEHFKQMPIIAIGQDEIDECALALFPNHSPATRNREVYTPMSAILKGAGHDFKLKRPKGGRGKKRTRWMWPDQAFPILEAARQLDPEFGIFLDQLLFSGLRKTELLNVMCDDLRLDEAFFYIRKSKNSEPQPVHMTPFMVASMANHPRGINRPGEKVFRFHAGGNFDWMLYAACAMASGLPKPKRWPKQGKRPERVVHPLDWVHYHYFRHTYGAWMRRYGGLDDLGMVATGRWKDIASVQVYAHAVTTDEARKADLLPLPKAENTR